MDLNNKNQQQEKEILKTASEDFEKNGGNKPMKDCIADAVLSLKKLSDFQYCSVFGVYFEDYINYLLRKMEVNNA